MSDPSKATAPLHICFLCNEYPPGRHGGIGSFVQTLARELVRQGHRASTVGLYPIARPVREEDSGVSVIRIPEGRIPNLRIASNYFRLQRVLRSLHRERPIDVLEGAERSFCLVSPRLPVPRLIRMHGGRVYFRLALGQVPDRQSVLEERRSFGVATHLCAVSRFVGESTREWLKLGLRRIPVILNPVDLRIFYPRDPALEEDGLIVYVGTMVEKKGIRQLVEAMPEVAAGYPAARLVAYGNDTSDPATGESFTAMLRRRLAPEVAGRIEFAGPVRRDLLPELMARAAVCVYPSHMEALPIAWVEGLAMGKAVVASQTGPGPEVVENGVSGLLANPHDPGSIAAALLRVLPDRGLRDRLGKAARERAERLFSLDRLVHENVAFYRTCAASEAAGY
jgi:glycosyltransferase involved in cell wall biosynthesis